MIRPKLRLWGRKTQRAKVPFSLHPIQGICYPLDLLPSMLTGAPAWGFSFPHFKVTLSSLFILSSLEESHLKECGVKLHLSECGESANVYGILLQGKFVSPLLFICLLFMQTFFFFFWVSGGTQYLFCTWGYNPVTLYSVTQIVPLVIGWSLGGFSVGSCDLQAYLHHLVVVIVLLNIFLLLEL